MKAGDLVVNRMDGGMGWCHPLDRCQTPGMLVRVTYDAAYAPTDPQWEGYTRPIAEVLWPGGSVTSLPLEDLMSYEDHEEELRQYRAEEANDLRTEHAGWYDLIEIDDDAAHSIYPEISEDWL